MSLLAALFAFGEGHLMTDDLTNWCSISSLRINNLPLEACDSLKKFSLSPNHQFRF